MSNYRYKDSGSGLFVSRDKAVEDPDGTYKLELKARKKKIKTFKSLNSKLKKAVNGLLVLSESDYPFGVFDKNLRSMSLNDFINQQSQLQPDSADQFNELKSLIERNLNNPVVMIVGAGSLKDLYVIGTDSNGQVRGIYSFVVET